MTTAWVNGVFGAGIAADDAGFQLGLGVFETLGVFRGELPLWSDHLARLHHGAAALGIPWTEPPGLRSAAMELLRRVPTDDILRITLTAGQAGEPTWCLTTRARTQGASHLLLHPVAHRPPATAAIKTTSRACYADAWNQAQAATAADALLVDEGDRLLETTTGNVFCWQAGVLHTPPLDGRILPGLARDRLLGELRSAGLTVEERDCPLTALSETAGFFVTNAVYGPRAATCQASAPPPALDPRVTAAWQRIVS